MNLKSTTLQRHFFSRYPRESLASKVKCSNSSVRTQSACLRSSWNLERIMASKVNVSNSSILNIVLMVRAGLRGGSRIYFFKPDPCGLLRKRLLHVHYEFIVSFRFVSFNILGHVSDNAVFQHVRARMKMQYTIIH